ncbi:hypothetical protein AB0O52_13265 [Arthrobacter sp. NPDC080073]|uniref:hypothetical protein n=1 Tax=Arthrobacter sp. NPDC080073 TaxID=3155919 RepID=UPI003418F0DD
MHAMAALAVVLLGAAGASGVDRMAAANISAPASIGSSVPAADGQPPLRRLVLRGLAEGSLPGGLPYDELREEAYNEKHQEKHHVEPAILA